ncbi:hypothetical protein KQX54_019324 [Cotesia glomerata]|uniref:Uncharacterized protein n=1 Tax=Cotesia glomerata TaxID=32391 RepID=A0AAV7J032_COTGL|nr:hypothetical protein KQX54_019324 [Cotesia glomerata]
MNEQVDYKFQGRIKLRGDFGLLTLKHEVSPQLSAPNSASSTPASFAIRCGFELSYKHFRDPETGVQDPKLFRILPTHLHQTR